MSNWTQSGYDPSLHHFNRGVIDDLPNEGYPNNYFYANSIRNVMIGFGNFFNDLYVIRYDENGEPIKRINVPLKFGPRTKAFDFRTEQESGKKYYITLPNLTYRITGLQFANERASGQKEVRAFYSEYFTNNGIDYIMANKFWKDVQPVPYNITITMEAKTEHISDATQIIEQICSRFAPEAYMNLKEFWFVNIRRSIKMKMDSPSIEINQDFGEEDKREITASFTFTIEAFLYKPIERAYIIDQIITKVSAPLAELEWTNGISGNFDGSLNKRYDIANAFGTKIGHVSAIVPDLTKYEYVPESSAHVTTYTYEELTDIKNYPITDSLTAIRYVQNESGEYEKKREYYHDSILVTAVSSYWNPAVKNYDVVTGFIPLSGYGKLPQSANFTFGTKDADLGTKYVKDAPYISSAATIKESR